MRSAARGLRLWPIRSRAEGHLACWACWGHGPLRLDFGPRTHFGSQLRCRTYERRGATHAVPAHAYGAGLRHCCKKLAASELKARTSGATRSPK
eukprot:1620750-Alexandrium_andersonii.AAC.1